MVFKLGGKFPLMRSAPDNSGIFQNLYSQAAKRIGCDLLSKNPTSWISDCNFRIHEECCGKYQPMYLGFSRLSIHMKETDNPQYQKDEEISAKNQTSIPAKGSIAQKFASALQALQKESVTKSIYQHWYPVTQKPFLKIE